MSNEAFKVLENFFKKFPLQQPNDITLPSHEFLILHLWLRGYKVVPISDEIDDE